MKKIFLTAMNLTKKLLKTRKIILNFITRFDNDEKSCPIGLKSLGLRVEYLDGLYKNRFSNARFSNLAKSPVSDVFYSKE